MFSDLYFICISLFQNKVSKCFTKPSKHEHKKCTIQYSIPVSVVFTVIDMFVIQVITGSVMMELNVRTRCAYEQISLRFRFLSISQPSSIPKINLACKQYILYYLNRANTFSIWLDTITNNYDKCLETDQQLDTMLSDAQWQLLHQISDIILTELSHSYLYFCVKGRQPIFPSL